MLCSVIFGWCFLDYLHRCPILCHNTLKCGKTKLLYNILAVSLFTFLCILDSIPSHLFTFLLICPICSLKLRISSSQSPKYLNTETCSICLSFSLNWTSLNTAFFLLPENCINVVFFTFRVNLL